MKVQNILESYIIKRTNALYEELLSSSNIALSCTCKNCRLETICYVLNRIPPKYIVSGRGVNHTMNIINSQMKTDVDVAILDGIRLTASTKRPYHWSSTKFFSPVSH
ncbi:MAG: late competence development ComFB family protein [Spirochaetaceae bacterium]|nr:late competence development ComFB family protein [Spirochaetaceae bacterium]